MLVSEKVSTIIKKRTPDTLPNAGNFVLDCNILIERFQRSLCNLGFIVNLMPYSVAMILGLTQFKPTGSPFLNMQRIDNKC